MRIPRRRVPIAFALIGACAVLSSIVFFYPICAIAWHLTRGNYITFANTRAKLPLLWWPTNDEGPYLQTLSRARVAQPYPLETIHIRRLRDEEIASDSALKYSFDLIAARNNARQNVPLGTFHVAEFRADNLKVYCLETQMDYLACRSPEMEWNITALPARHPDEIMAILTSLQRLH